MFHFALWLSLFGYLLGCALLSRQRSITVGASLLGGLLALISSAQLISRQVAGTGINEAVWYHLVVGLEGAGLAEYGNTFWLGGALLVGVVLYTWLTHRLVGRVSAGLVVTLLGAGVALGASAMNPGVRDLSMTLRGAFSGQAGAGLPEDLALPDAVTLRDGVDRPRNLVLIYAESLEAGYFDDERFPGLLPRLGAMRARGISFGRVDSLPGTTWTIGGMVASQCGIPLVTASDTNNASVEAATFLPEARCLGDILAAHGYRQHYLGGADRHFADKYLFYRSHGTDRIDGRDQLIPQLADPDYVNYWGLFDDSLLDMAAARFDRLAESDEPFALTVLTLDTHHPRGHWSARCHDRPYADGTNPMLNAVHCADDLLADFVEHAQRDDDTLVVVVSDHLAFPNTAMERLEQGERYNLFMMPGEFPETLSGPYRPDRQASTLDVAPTVLHRLGFALPALGYGRNLLAEEATFSEAHGAPDIALRERFPVVRRLWGYPDLREGVWVDPVERQARIGGHAFSLPAMVLLDEALRLERTGHADELHGALEERGGAGYFLWFHDCSQLPALLRRRPEEGKGRLCWQGGRHDGINGPARELDADERLLSPDTLRAMLEGTPDRRLNASWRRYLRRQARGGGHEVRPEEASEHALAVIVEARPLPGRAFFYWQELRDRRRYSPRIIVPRWQAAALTPVFDHRVPAPTADPEYRSAWAAVMVKGGPVLAEHLSPGESASSIARVMLRLPEGMELNVRSTGGIPMKGWDEAYLRRDEEALMTLRRGINLWVETPEGEQARYHFDTHGERDASDRLMATLARLPDGALLVFVTHDEFTRSLSPSALQHLRSMGLLRGHGPPSIRGEGAGRRAVVGTFERWR